MIIYSIIGSFIAFGIGLCTGLYAYDKKKMARDLKTYELLLNEQKEVNKQLKAYNEILKQHNDYLMHLEKISQG